MEQYMHGGNVYAAARRLGVEVSDIIDLSSNTVMTPPPVVSRVLGSLGDDIARLPDPDAIDERRVIGEAVGVAPANIVIAAGTTELIDAICRIHAQGRTGIVEPTYVDYERFARANLMPIRHIATKADNGFRPSFSGVGDPDVLFICNPNNPTGVLLDRAVVEAVANDHPETIVVVDESYLPFVEDERTHTLTRDCPDNVIVLRSYSKVFGIPGIRAGYAVCGSAAVARLLSRHVAPWSPSAPARAVMTALAGVSAKAVAAEIARLRERFVDGVGGYPWITAYPSTTNFVLLKSNTLSSHDLAERFLRERILIRDCANIRGLDDSYIRISIRDEAGVSAALSVFAAIDGET